MMYYLTREARVDPQTPSQNVSASQAAFGRQQEEAKREQKDEDALDRVARSWRAVRADAAADTAAVDAVLKAWRASKDVVAAKPEEKKELRPERDRRIRQAKARGARVRVLLYREVHSSVVPQVLTAKQHVVAMTAKQNERQQCPSFRGDRSLSSRAGVDASFAAG